MRRMHANGLPMTTVYAGPGHQSITRQHLARLTSVLAGQAFVEAVLATVGPVEDVMARWELAAQLQQGMALN